jgi:multidrug efflux pump subunit AcrA (membrane-fusion protein)
MVMAALLAALATVQAQADSQKKKAAPPNSKAPRTIRLPATIEASEEARLHGRIGGYVQKVQADIGDRVKEGQVLVEISMPKDEAELKEKEARLQQAHAELEQAQQAVQLAETEVVAVKTQKEVGTAISRKADSNVKVAEARVKMAMAGVKVAEARLEVVKSEVEGVESLLHEATVRAPFDGIVVKRSASPGEFVPPAESSRAEPLFIVVKIDFVRVVVQVPEEFAPSVGIGTQALIEIPSLDGKRFEGQVTRTGGTLSAENRTLHAEIDLPNGDGKLLPGMHGSVILTLGHASE